MQKGWSLEIRTKFRQHALNKQSVVTMGFRKTSSTFVLLTHVMKSFSGMFSSQCPVLHIISWIKFMQTSAQILAHTTARLGRANKRKPQPEHHHLPFHIYRLFKYTTEDILYPINIAQG